MKMMLAASAFLLHFDHSDGLYLHLCKSTNVKMKLYGKFSVQTKLKGKLPKNTYPNYFYDRQTIDIRMLQNAILN